jgi:hypothetical protein
MRPADWHLPGHRHAAAAMASCAQGEVASQMSCGSKRISPKATYVRGDWFGHLLEKSPQEDFGRF